MGNFGTKITFTCVSARRGCKSRLPDDDFTFLTYQKNTFDTMPAVATGFLLTDLPTPSMAVPLFTVVLNYSLLCSKDGGSGERTWPLDQHFRKTDVVTWSPFRMRQTYTLHMHTRKKQKESGSWSRPGLSGLADRKVGGRSLVGQSKIKYFLYIKSVQHGSIQ